MSKVVRSIDVGYGQTKFVKDDDGSRIDTEMFPSICKTATGRLDAIGAKLSTQADVIQVTTSDGREASHLVSAMQTVTGFSIRAMG